MKTENVYGCAAKLDVSLKRIHLMILDIFFSSSQAVTPCSCVLPPARKGNKNREKTRALVFKLNVCTLPASYVACLFQSSHHSLLSQDVTTLLPQKKMKVLPFTQNVTPLLLAYSIQPAVTPPTSVNQRDKQS
ncbi:hypothetical protein VIGAN_08276400 [Vigna angularis var. angularis]|uniref:Uncharacterized protein n=1 Tax=Vigna angularis var. angularis TaxID=157739 RepID=A0A0S3SSS9_PHAAN|nr:hypothetical protein VIGAN_08276400 [Vigna angularis var. angularis]